MNAPLLPLLIFAAGVLYSSVGHGGASAYLAAMALCGVAPESMKPAALVLNVLVATIGMLRYGRAGCFSWPLFLPFALGAVPMAFAGGFVTLPGNLYKQAVGLVLLFAAVKLVLPSKSAADDPVRPVAFPAGVLCGAGIGLLSGLTGTGGGIFLTPLLLFMGWANARTAAGVTVVFILANSIAGLMGRLSAVHTLPLEVVSWAAAALLGGLIGSELGSRRFGSATIRRMLGVVLVIAGGKLILV